MIANTPNPPYYAVIFTAIRTEVDEGYAAMAEAMEKLAEQQQGFLGIESARNEVGITVSYWESLEAIKIWKENEQHKIAQKFGREKWYKDFTTRVCKVERAYEM